MKDDSVTKIPSLIKDLYYIVSKLEKTSEEILGEKRPFTLDGHLVGSIGEVLVAYYYNLKLMPPSNKGYDAKSQDGREVQIKATQGNRIGLRESSEHLIVIKILEDANIVEVYNGPGELAWDSSGTLQNNGQRAISISKLKTLMRDIKDNQKITKVI